MLANEKSFQIASHSLLFLAALQEEKNMGSNPSVFVRCGKDNVYALLILL